MFLLPLLLLLSCETDVLEPKPVGEAPFSLRHGETAVVRPSGALIRFDELLDDSRCPLDLECFWEGKADLRMWLRTPAADEIILQLSIYGYVTSADTARQLSVDTLGYRITLLQLDPYSQRASCSAVGEYVALLKVSSL